MRELGRRIVKPPLREELLGASEVGFNSIGGQLMDAARCLSCASQQTRDAQQLPGGDCTHVVRHMVTRHHLARLVDNDTV